MKKSNKLTAGYVITSLLLLAVLFFGGIYGVYVSVGLKFMRSSISNITDGVNGGVSNVSYGGTVNFSPGMSGVIILSLLLIVLAVLDMISLIKQIVFFKQFKIIRNSKLESIIEKKTKSKNSVVFFACLINLLSIAAGIAGIFINSRSLAGSNLAWIIYVIDGLVAVLAIVSLVLLFIKLSKVKKIKKELQDSNIKVETKPPEVKEKEVVIKEDLERRQCVNLAECNNLNIDELEYNLYKIKHLKNNRLLTSDEYEQLRRNILGVLPSKKEVSTKTVDINEQTTESDEHESVQK